MDACQELALGLQVSRGSSPKHSEADMDTKELPERLLKQAMQASIPNWQDSMATVHSVKAKETGKPYLRPRSSTASSPRHGRVWSNDDFG